MNFSLHARATTSKVLFRSSLRIFLPAAGSTRHFSFSGGRQTPFPALLSGLQAGMPQAYSAFFAIAPKLHTPEFAAGREYFQV
jgi:hypothetical protein